MSHSAWGSCERWRKFALNLHSSEVMSQVPSRGRAADPALLTQTQCSSHDPTQHFYVGWCCTNSMCAGNPAVKIFVTLCSSLNSREMSVQILIRYINKGRGGQKYHWIRVSVSYLPILLLFHPYQNYEGRPPNWNYLLEGRPLVVQVPLLGTVPGTHLYQCISWWCCERLRLASVKFF